MATAVGADSMGLDAMRPTATARTDRSGQQRWWLVGLPIMAALLLLLAALWLAADAESAQSQIGGAYVGLFAIAAIAVLVLVGAVADEAWRLWRRWRVSAPGSRLNLRLAILIALLAIPPTLLVSGFAMRFVEVGIDSWFRADVEASQSAAEALGRDVLLSFERRARDRSNVLAERTARASGGDLQATLDALVDGIDEPLYLTVYDDNGVLLALAFNTSSIVLPKSPSEAERLQVRQAGQLGMSERIQDTLAWRVLDRVPGVGLLQAIFPLPVDLAPRLETLERTAVDYAQLRFQRRALKFSFVLILGLVSLLALLGALYTALAASARLIQPISDLAAATGDIAAGRYDQHLPVSSHDELGFLTASFNSMAAALNTADARERASRAEIELHRAHLQAVLERLSAGVLSFDGERILTANPAAGALLDLDANALVDCSIAMATQKFPRAAALFAGLATHAERDEPQWREEIILVGEPKRVLLVRAVRLPGTAAARYVAVFDDAEVLAHAQREAAWAEVARRLAHEIKNPLTPIQLAAERLRHKYLGKMAAADAEVLDRATHTIVAQVDALKNIVNAFADYARPAQGERRQLDLAALCNDVLDLYEHSGQCLLQRDLSASPVLILGNRDRLRQALVNLLTNAIEAGKAGVTPSIELRLVERTETIELSVRDHGSGLPAGFDERWFEPYTTTKIKGTGLGLAMVRKIAEEHGGSVRGENAEGGGARFVLVVPRR